MNKNAMRGEASGAGMAGGIALGLVLALAYVKLGFSLPAWLQPADQIKSALISGVVSVAVDQNKLPELQREIAFGMKDAGNYVDLDNSLDGFITEEIIWRSRTKTTLKLLQDEIKAMQHYANDDRYSSLAPSLERLITRLPVETAAEQVLVHRFLERRFPGQSDARIVEQLGSLSLAALLQIQYPSARIVFSLPLPALVRLTIYNAQDEAVNTLIDADMPAGQFRLSWDFRGTDGQREAATDSYTYRLWINDQLRRESNLETPKAIWE